jgi:hypothetical protein
MSVRRILSNRRTCETYAFLWRGMRITATVARFDDGRLAEIFLSNGKVNSQADTTARDSAVIASISRFNMVRRLMCCARHFCAMRTALHRDRSAPHWI